MNSQTLKQNGFSEPCLMKSISYTNLPFNKSSVFVILDTTLTGKAPSDILYIGRSKRPTRKILGGYLGGYGGKNVKKINSSLFDEGYIEKVSISWMLVDKPKAKQRELIDKFVQEHGEFPLWNASRKQRVKFPKKTPAARPKPMETVTAKTTKPQPSKRRGRPKVIAPPAPAKSVVAPAKPTMAPAKAVEPSSAPSAASSAAPKTLTNNP